MNVLPTELLESLTGVQGFDRERFESAHTSGARVHSIRINPAKLTLQQLEFGGAAMVPWSAYGYYLPERPLYIFDPLLHAGAYYVQEASSMFLEQVLRQTCDLTAPLRVLDLCAAPGGKSTHLLSLLNDSSLLVANEVVRARASILEENIVKWSSHHAMVTSNDPRDFSRLPHFFDVMVIDAPCSGSGLFRRDPQAISEWSPEAVKLCWARQQRIITDSFNALKPGGVLVYSTCSYSREEDEDIMEWMVENFGMDGIQLEVPLEWGIVEVPGKRGSFGYRFYPDRIAGEGLFICCLRKGEGPAERPGVHKKIKRDEINQNERTIVQPWLTPAADVTLTRVNGDMVAFSSPLMQDLDKVREQLFVRKAGIALGRLAGSELLPAHDLAVSLLASPEIVSIPLKKEEALQYLRKEQVTVSAASRGWAIARYQHLGLGWMKVLGNRVNNYYPKEWRILKQPEN